MEAQVEFQDVPEFLQRHISRLFHSEHKEINAQI